MNATIVSGIVLFCIAVTTVVVANVFLIMMIGEINRKRQEEPISYFGFWFPKILQILGEYRALYPAGKLHIYAIGTFALAMACLASVAVCLSMLR